MTAKIKIGLAKTITVAVALCCVSACGMMYIYFRPDTLKMFHFFRYIGILDILESMKQDPSIVDSWVLYNLPDGVWLFAYAIIIGCIWNFKIRDCWKFILVMPTISISHEFMQGLGIMHGTYDQNDVFAYIIAVIAGFTYIYAVDRIAFGEVGRVERRRTSSLKLLLTMISFALFVLLAIGSDDTVGRISANTGCAFEKVGEGNDDF